LPTFFLKEKGEVALPRIKNSKGYIDDNLDKRDLVFDEDASPNTFYKGGSVGNSLPESTSSNNNNHKKSRGKQGSELPPYGEARGRSGLNPNYNDSVVSNGGNGR
jgi:hypothetical protein